MNNIYERHVFVCTSGKTCPKKGPVEDILGLMRQEIKSRGLKDKIRINKSGCLDWCDSGPVMVCYPEGVWYTNIQLEDVPQILEEHIINGKPVERLVYKPEKE
ncbi:MAG: (2Fe-2S) ferredoxin domain-containing protein [Candidatus Sericytochromatia bacterium]|nr:(2Fe-2S) ferredoxin domain-containing protein [Candidatus Sericytochromatia bacterium]